MRVLMHIRCLTMFGVMFCAHVSFADLVVNSVRQEVEATLYDGIGTEPNVLVITSPTPTSPFSIKDPSSGTRRCGSESNGKFGAVEPGDDNVHPRNAGCCE